MHQHTSRVSSTLKQLVFAGLFLALLGFVTTAPASAQDIHSYMKTGIINVMPDQTLAVSVADVGAPGSGSEVRITIYDGDGGILRKATRYLTDGKTMTLRVSEDMIPAASPDFQMRVVVDRLWTVGEGSLVTTTFDIMDPVLGVNTPGNSCGGPAARNPDPELNVNCPGVWQAGWIIP